MKSIIYIVLMFAFVACGTISHITIDTKQPAEIVFSPMTTTLSLIANPREMASDEGNIYISMRNKKSLLKIEKDSLVPIYMDEFINRLQSVGYFRRIKDVTNREASDSRLNFPLSETEAKEIMLDNVSQSLLSLEKLEFQSVLKESYFPGEAYLKSVFEIRINSCFRLYSIENPDVKTYLFSDTLFWEGFGFTPEQAVSALPPLEDCFADAALYVADRNVNRVAPFMKPEDRFLYIPAHSTMREAAKYVKRDMWDEASYLWEYAFENEKNRDIRMKAAFNLALYNEIWDRFDVSLQWIDKAYSLNPKANSIFEKDLLWYKERLQQRRKEFERLQPQIID